MNTPSSPDLADPSVYTLVRRIYYRRFSQRVEALSLDPAEGLQEVFEGLVRKSRSERSRWDPKRGGLSTWVFVAVSGLVMNLAQKHHRRVVLDYEEDGGGEVEAGSSWGSVELRDLAEEMNLPVEVLAGLASGLNGFEAGMAGGLDFFEASELGSRFAA